MHCVKHTYVWGILHFKKQWRDERSLHSGDSEWMETGNCVWEEANSLKHMKYFSSSGGSGSVLFFTNILQYLHICCLLCPVSYMYMRHTHMYTYSIYVCIYSICVCVYSVCRIMCHLVMRDVSLDIFLLSEHHECTHTNLNSVAYSTSRECRHGSIAPSLYLCSVTDWNIARWHMTVSLKRKKGKQAIRQHTMPGSWGVIGLAQLLGLKAQAYLNSLTHAWHTWG